MRESEPHGWRHGSVEVRPSDIAGHGWFANVDLPAGTVVLRLETALAGATGLTGLGSGFPNHSCDPGLGWVDERSLATVTDVPAGSELVTDYALCLDDAAWFLRCHCPSYRCRQMVEGTDWRIAQLQQRYDGWWTPHVQRLVDQSRAG